MPWWLWCPRDVFNPDTNMAHQVHIQNYYLLILCLSLFIRKHSHINLNNFTSLFFSLSWPCVLSIIFCSGRPIKQMTYHWNPFMTRYSKKSNLSGSREQVMNHQRFNNFFVDTTLLVISFSICCVSVTSLQWCCRDIFTWGLTSRQWWKMHHYRIQLLILKILQNLVHKTCETDFFQLSKTS